MILPLQEYMDAMFTGIHNKVDEIKIHSGALQRYESAGTTTRSRGQHVRRLGFCHTKISGGALRTLSCEFPELDFLEFNMCKIDNSSTINVDMPYSAIKTLSIIDGNSTSKPIMLISVYCKDQNTSKYSVGAISVDETLEDIGGKKFELFKSTLKSENTKIV